MKQKLPAPFAGAKQQLDARDLECPQPVIECRRTLHTMQAGESLHIIANDPNTVLDFEVFCMRTGHQLLASLTEPDNELHFLIRKRPVQARP